MAQAVRQVSAKRYFRHWRSQLDTQVGAKLLSRTLDRALMRTFFMRVDRKAAFEEEATRHMSLFRCFKLLEFTFHLGLQRNVELKALRSVAQEEVMPEISRALRKREYLRRWREALASNQREMRMAHFCIVQIKNKVAAKYFEVLKQRYLWGSRKNQVARAYVRKTKL